MMMLHMIVMTIKKLEISDYIITPVSINMMHNFAFLEKPSNVLLHNQMMFSYITFLISVWMIRHFDMNISIPIRVYSTVPPEVLASCGLTLLKVGAASVGLYACILIPRLMSFVEPFAIRMPLNKLSLFVSHTSIIAPIVMVRKEAH